MSRNSGQKAREWDKELSLVMDVILDGAIKIKQAAEVGRRAVEYFRGVDFCKYILKNRDMFVKKYAKVLEGNPLETLADAEDIGNRLIRKGFIYRAQYKPFEGTNQQSENGEVKKPKWPKRLSIYSKQVFEEDGFYIIIYEGNKSWHYLMLTAIITAVLLLCMFPAWPLAVKVAVWYVSVIMLTIILAMVFGRLILFVIFWFFGVDFWFMPNLFNDDAGLLDSFVPVIQFVYRNDTWLMFAARLFCALLSAVSIYKLGETHSVSDVSMFAKQSFLDVLDWGHQKLAAVPQNKPKYPSINDIENSVHEEHENTNTKNDLDNKNEEDQLKTDDDNAFEEDYSCLKDCGYETFNELMDGCLMECQCMTKLISSSCYSKCHEDIRNILKEGELEACQEEEERKKKRKSKQEL